MTAAREWLENQPEFELDSSIDTKLQITAAPSGYLKRIMT
jgi:cephalosporin hydroxylase